MDTEHLNAEIEHFRIDYTDDVGPFYTERRARFEAFVAELRANALEAAADDYQERADHETPADIDPDWLRARAGRLRRGEPTSGATVETPPQSDFVEEFGQEE